MMVFLETPSFSKVIAALLSDKEYLRLQVFLMDYPDAGDLVPHGHGLRKLRWRIRGRGKRGGLRVIYYFAPSRRQILMLDAFAKAKKEDLTRRQLYGLTRLLEEWRRG